MENLTKRILKDQLTTMLTMLMFEGERQLSEAQTTQYDPYLHPYIKRLRMDKYTENIRVLQAEAENINASVQRVLNL